MFSALMHFYYAIIGVGALGMAMFVSLGIMIHLHFRDTVRQSRANLPPTIPAHCVTCNKAGTRAEMHQVSALDFACCEACVSKYVSEWGI